MTADHVPHTTPDEPASAGRHRLHRFPGRRHAVKVLYDDDELAAVHQAAAGAGLRPASFVATAALSAATESPARNRTPAADRRTLAELLQLRTAVVHTSADLHRLATLHGSGAAPAGLEHAVSLSAQTLADIDEAARLIVRRLR